MAGDMEVRTTTLWEDWENCRAYHSSIGLTSDLPKYVRFYEGKQWPAPTANTKNLPRPVVNIIKMICRNKKSAILSTPVRIIYRAETEASDVEKFNRFADYIQKELGQSRLDKEAIHDAVVKGPYAYHYYWDAEARGMDGIHEGALRGEIIDALNIGFSNPEERDEQKQRWIIIRSREDVSAVRAKCDKDVDPNTICADEADNEYGRTEQDGDSLCTVLTRYFRKDGEVYYEKATMNTVVNRAVPLAPDIEAARRDLGFADDEKDLDAPNNSLPDKSGQSPAIQKARAPFYPVVVGSYEPREKSIYGIGEVEGLIPNQKAINFMLAMLLLNAQEVAWGKYVVLPNALGKQVITNTPGQTLTDYTGTGQGIRKMTEQTIQTMPLQLVDTLASLTRTVTGSGEVMTGETISAGMSGAAIAQLQSQALIPVEELKESFWLVKEKQGKVMAQFFKLFYHNRSFRYVDVDSKAVMGTNQSDQAFKTDIFEGSEYENTDFDVVVEAVGGTKASAAGDINILDSLFAAGKISLKTYIATYPKDAISNKSELLREIEAEEQSVVMKLQQENDQMAEQINAYAAVIEEQASVVEKVDSIIRENEGLRGLLANLYQEAREKIAEANRIISRDGQIIDETTADARAFAQEIVERDRMELRGNPSCS